MQFYSHSDYCRYRHDLEMDELLSSREANEILVSSEEESESEFSKTVEETDEEYMEYEDLSVHSIETNANQEEPMESENFATGEPGETFFTDMDDGLNSNETEFLNTNTDAMKTQICSVEIEVPQKDKLILSTSAVIGNTKMNVDRTVNSKPVVEVVIGSSRVSNKWHAFEFVDLTSPDSPLPKSGGRQMITKVETEVDIFSPSVNSSSQLDSIYEVNSDRSEISFEEDEQLPTSEDDEEPTTSEGSCDEDSIAPAKINKQLKRDKKHRDRHGFIIPIRMRGFRYEECEEIPGFMDYVEYLTLD